MIISAASDYRAAAQRYPATILFRYIDGGACTNIPCAATLKTSPTWLRQHILRNIIGSEPGRPR